MKDKPLRIFFSGIGGSGVSAIAVFMTEKGHVVSGSDRTFDTDPDHPLKKFFKSRGINIMPQDGCGVDKNLDFVVFSTAVESDRPEMLKARALGVPVKTRPDYLAEIAGAYKTIAVSGTSGKSTASGILAFLMKRLGLEPNFIGGGRVKQFKSAVDPGNSLSGDSDYLVIEACESDGTIVNYRPRYSIILNLAFDHHAIEKTAGMFKTLIENTIETVILNADDDNLARMADKKTKTFSIDNPSDYRAEDIRYGPFSTDFFLRNTRFVLSLPGRHNLYNALSCMALLSEIGIPPEAVSSVLPEFHGIERRFDVYLKEGGRLVIDDYAHNPHKISSLMQTVNRMSEKVCYIFQPHGFAPTRLMKKEYIETFVKNLRGSDHLIILPIFYAGGTAARDISSRDLADGIKAAGSSAEAIESRQEIFNRLDDYNSYIVFGARDESLADLAREIAEKLKT